MIADAEELAEGTVLTTDVCIIGAGAAGIAMALRLRGRGQRGLLLEAGGDAETPEQRDMLAGDVADLALHSPAEHYRHRVLGGTTSTWGGRCIPLDPIDFDTRSWIPDSGWPIAYADIAPFYPDALTVAEAGDDDFDPLTAVSGGMKPMVRGFAPDNFTADNLERSSAPTNFGRRYRHLLAEASDIEVLLGANCTEIIASTDGTAIQSLAVATNSGKRLTVQASSFVVATGGMETARLLLASRRQNPLGIGNDHDLVGRYYMCHIAGTTAEVRFVVPPDQVFHGYERAWDGVYLRRRLHLRPEAQARLQTGNIVMRLHHPRLPDPQHGRGVLSAIYLAKPFVGYEYAKRLHSTDPMTIVKVLHHVLNVVREPFATIGFLARLAWTRTLADRKFPSLIVSPRNNRYTLDVHAEQTPNPDSRITLSDRLDRYGMPLVRIDWRWRQLDIDGVTRALEALAIDLKSSGKGELIFSPDAVANDMLRDGAYGGHHIGTARMSNSPATGVVDANCKVFGLDNLFIAGSAVFPTSGQANPTLTIIALALRLADHLVPAGRGEGQTP